MSSMGDYIPIIILLSLLLIGIISNQISNYRNKQRNKNGIGLNLKARIIRLVLLLGFTITTGMIFFGLVFALLPNNEINIVRNSFLIIVLGIIGSIGIIIIYNKKYSTKKIKINISERAISLSDFAIKYQLDTLRIVGTPVDPVLVIQEGEERIIIKIIGGEFEEKVGITMDQLSPQYSQIDAYALAYDVRLPYGNKKYDAIVSEVGEISSPKAILLAQRYIPKSDDNNSIEIIGLTMLLGERLPRVNFEKVNKNK